MATEVTLHFAADADVDVAEVAEEHRQRTNLREKMTGHSSRRGLSKCVCKMRLMRSLDLLAFQKE